MIRMVKFEEIDEVIEEEETVQRVGEQSEEEWIILDSGSDVSFLPS